MNDTTIAPTPRCRYCGNEAADTAHLCPAFATSTTVPAPSPSTEREQRPLLVNPTLRYRELLEGKVGTDWLIGWRSMMAEASRSSVSDDSRDAARLLQQARDALQALSKHADGLMCRHEDTYRGGAIWTICRDCGQKWADDRGGFVPFTEPASLTTAFEAIAAIDAALAAKGER